MIAHRAFPKDESARPSEPGGPLFWARELQGSGRHDNPDRYACMYLSELEVSPVAEALAPFRGSGPLLDEMLVRGERRLALAAIELPDDAPLIDLDDPAVLGREGLRPSRVATRRRTLTQADAEELFERHPDAAGLRWWSTLESLWPNVTLFDRVARRLRVRRVRSLAVGDDAVEEAAAFLGLAGR